MQLSELFDHDESSLLENGFFRIAETSEGMTTPENIFRAKQTLDSIARDMPKTATTQPRRLIKDINDYLFDRLGFSDSNKASPLLPETVVNNAGNCLGLSSLYLVLGERQGLPLFGVNVPGHIFVRYQDGDNPLNIETTRKGESLSDEWYGLKFHVPVRSLRNMTKRDVLVYGLLNRSISYLEKGIKARDDHLLDLATDDANTVLDHDRENSIALMLLSAAHLTRRNYDSALSNSLKVLHQDHNIDGASHFISIACLATGHPDQAIPYLDAAIEQNGADTAARLMRAMACSTIPTIESYTKFFEDLNIKEIIPLLTQHLMDPTFRQYAQRAIMLYHSRYGGFVPLDIETLVQRELHTPSSLSAD